MLPAPPHKFAGTLNTAGFCHIAHTTPSLNTFSGSRAECDDSESITLQRWCEVVTQHLGACNTPNSGLFVCDVSGTANLRR
jgi:hypothetical protein